MAKRLDLTVPGALLVEFLRHSTSRDLAQTSEELAHRLSLTLNGNCDARRVRSIISEENAEISRALLPAVLVSQAPYGSWLATDAEQIRQREELLWKLERQARQKRKEFIATVRAAGLEGILSNRKAAA